VTPRGSRRYSPREEPLLEEGLGAWRPERTEHRQQSRLLPEQRERRGRKRTDTRVSCENNARVVGQFNPDRKLTVSHC
jgi:hypothetical protein